MRIKLAISILFTIFFCSAKEKPIILWDLHGVLFHQKSFVITFLKSPELYRIISHINWQFIKDLLRSGITNIEYLPITKKYHNPYLRDFLLHAVNNVVLLPAMKDLVYELAADGYAQQIASNINPLAFAHLTNPHRHPEYAPFFALFNIPASQTGYLSNGMVIRKPNVAYFQTYLAKNNLNPFEDHIIFIDDIRENIIAARNLGFDAILFKNPYQLRTELRARSIDVAPPPYIFSNQLKSYTFSMPSLLSSK